MGFHGNQKLHLFYQVSWPFLIGMFWLCTCIIIINIIGFKSTVLLFAFYFSLFFFLFVSFLLFYCFLLGCVQFYFLPLLPNWPYIFALCSVIMLHFTICIFNIPQFYFKWYYNTPCKIYDCYEIINSSAQFFELLSIFYFYIYQKPHDKVLLFCWAIQLFSSSFINEKNFIFRYPKIFYIFNSRNTLKWYCIITK